MGTFTDYIKATLEHTPERIRGGIEILTECGISESDAAIIEEAAYRACQGSALAIAKVIDDFPEGSRIRAAGIAHIIGSVNKDTQDLFDIITKLAMIAGFGGNVMMVTRGKEACDCDRCTATKALIQQLSVE